jgi:hypothetical protein
MGTLAGLDEEKRQEIQGLCPLNATEPTATQGWAICIEIPNQRTSV